MKTSFFILNILVFAGLCQAQWQDHSMHFPQTPDPDGWHIGQWCNTFVMADDFRCSKSGPISNIVFWGSWQDDIIGDIQNFLVTIYQGSTNQSNIIWKGAVSNHDYPSYSEFKFDITPMPTIWQGWFDPVEDYYDFNTHQQWTQINIHTFSQPCILQQGLTYWIKIEELWSLDALDPNNYDVIPTLGWKESDKHFGSKAKIYCDPCYGWKSLSDPITGNNIDLAFVVISKPPKGDINEDGKINHQDLKLLSQNWLQTSANQRQVSDLLAQWQFENPGSLIALDSSPLQNNADLHNGASQLDGTLILDGIDDYLQTPESPNSLQLTGDYTLTAWLNPNQTQDQWAGIITKTSPKPEFGFPQVHWSMQFGAFSVNTLDKIIIYNSTKIWDTDIGLSQLTGGWHHIAVVRSSNSMISFLDGQIKKYTENFEHNPVGGNGTLKIGTERNNNSYFAGMLDDIRIYDYPLTPEEIQLVFQDSPLPAQPAPTVCYQGPFGDLNNDCKINFDDFAIIAKSWLSGEN